MIIMLHKMQHHIQSTYGDSIQLQGWQQWALPIAGIGQGNGAGPQIWAAVSSPLFQMLTADRVIAQVLCTISAHKYSLSGFGFVDDVNLCITATNNDSTMVMEQMQKSLQMWAGLIHATGGALIPNKCFWYYVHNHWENGKWTYSQPTSQYCLQVPDNHGHLITIPQLGLSEAWQTLGVCLAPDGNNNAEAEYLLKVSKKWQQLMATAKVSHLAVEFSLRQVILRKLKYPLVSMMFTRNQCTNIMKPHLVYSLQDYWQQASSDLSHKQ